MFLSAFLSLHTFIDTTGRSEQAPLLGADKLIVNSIAPDPDEFAQAFIECLNASSSAFAYENEYISGTKIKVICKKAGYSLAFWPHNFINNNILYVDGYALYGFVAYNNGNDSADKDFYDKLGIESGELYCITGNIQYDNSYGLETARISIESIELYAYDGE